MWIWDSEILMGFSIGEYVQDSRGGHHIREPRVSCFARSIDGGRMWSREQPENIDKRPTAVLPGGIDFCHKNLAYLLLLGESNQHGPSHCLVSYDRGRTWDGPYYVPNVGLGTITRTDYIVENKDECTAMFTCAKPNPNGHGVVEGRVACVRTKDGGKTFNLVGWVGNVPAGYEIMPSTIRCSSVRLVTAIRCGLTNEDSYLAVRRSDDNGATWKEMFRFPQKWNSNPGALVRTRSGMLTLAFADRRKLAIFATVSDDNGETWSSPNPLREDCANWDMGYCKSVLRGDGTIITGYYYSTKERPEMHIAATLWQPKSIYRP